MYDDFVTEADALGEMYDGLYREPWENYEPFEPYSDAEKRAYIRRQGVFSQIHKGKFVVVRTPDTNKRIVTRLYLVDRSITKRFWWSPYSIFAMIFNNKEEAERTANRYKYGNVKVFEIK